MVQSIVRTWATVTPTMLCICRFISTVYIEVSKYFST